MPTKMRLWSFILIAISLEELNFESDRAASLTEPRHTEQFGQTAAIIGDGARRVHPRIVAGLGRRGSESELHEQSEPLP
jgi:hypothetical protein